MLNKKILFASACLGLFIAGNVFVSFGTFSIYLKNTYLLDEISMGSISAMLAFGILIGSVIFGPVVDRYGYKLLLIISTLIVVMGIELIAIGGSEPLLYFAFLLSGIGGGVINGSTTALVADISQEEKSADMSLLHAFFGLGALSMPFFSGIMLNYLRFDRIFFYCGFLILLSIFFYLRIVYPVPKQPHGLSLKKTVLLLKEAPLLLLSSFLFFQSGMESIVNNWTIRYLQNKCSSEAGDLIYLLSILAIGIIIVRVLLGIFLRKSNPKTILLISLCISSCGIITLWFSSVYLFFVVGVFFIGVGFSSIFPLMLGFVSEKYPDYSGTALGITFIIALFGSVLFNLIMGIVSKTFGIDKYPVILFSLISIMIACVPKITKLNSREKRN